MRKPMLYESLITSYLIKKNSPSKKTFVRLMKLCDAELKDVKDKIRRNECPFCGTKFTMKANLIRHIMARSNSCSVQFAMSVDHVVRIYTYITECGE